MPRPRLRLDPAQKHLLTPSTTHITHATGDRRAARVKMTYFASVPQFVPPPVPSSGRRRRPRPPSSSSSTRSCRRWCPSPSQWGSACSFLGRMIVSPCLPTNTSSLPTTSSSNPSSTSRLKQCLTVSGVYLKNLCRALGPDPDVSAPLPPSSSSSQPSSSSSISSLHSCFSASTIPPPIILRTETQLHAWEEQRRRRAWVLIARHWGGMIVLNLLFLLDSRFRSLVEGMLDCFYTSAVMAMVLFAVVALSNPGYLPLHFSVVQEEEEEEEGNKNEDKQHDGREAAQEEGEQQEQQQQQGVLLLEEGRGGGGGGGQKEKEKEKEPRPRMASGAGDLDIIEEEDGREEGREEAVEGEEEEEEDEAELCAYLGEDASLTGSDEREEEEEEGGEEDLDSDSESLLLEVVEATSTTAAAAAGGEGGAEGVVKEWLRRRYCAACRVHRMPLRTKHCKGCGRCVSRLDHHSPWVGNCIGAGNHLSFVLFLLFQSLHLSLALLLLLLLGLPTFLSHYNFDRGLFGLLGGLSQNLLFAAPQAILEQPLPSLLFLLVAFLWCVSHAALFAQLKVVCSNLLTVEARGGGGKFPYLVGGKNPFDKGCFWNVISFLSLFYHYHQERRTKERRQKQRQARREGGSFSFSSSSWPSTAALALSSSLSSSSASSSSSSSSSYSSATLGSPPHSASSTSSLCSSSSSSSSHSSPSSSPCDSPTAALLSSSSINSFSFRSLSSSAVGAASSASSSAASSSFFTYFRRKFSSASTGGQQQQQQQRQQQHLHPPAYSFFRSKKSGPLPLPLKIAP